FDPPVLFLLGHLGLRARPGGWLQPWSGGAPAGSRRRSALQVRRSGWGALATGRGGSGRPRRLLLVGLRGFRAGRGLVLLCRRLAARCLLGLRRLAGGRLRFSLPLDQRDRSPDRDRLTLRNQDLLEHSGLVSRDLDGRFLGLDLGNGLLLV